MSQRRHDLDAVRSFAMLLGIGLHAALAYIGAMWLVSDTPTSASLGIAVAGVHGFRMPLFFLLSGFFTAMLWRRRGMRGLLLHRGKRIALPLLVGCITIVPLMSVAADWAISRQSAHNRESAPPPEAGTPAPTPDIWAVAAYGDLPGLRAYGPGSDMLDMPDPVFGVTPLGWAAIRNQPESAAYLLSVGASPSARYRDRNTPLHTACFFGRYEVAELLIAAGADATLASAMGEQPRDSLAHDRPTTEYFANLLQVPIDFQEVQNNRLRIGALLDAGPKLPENNDAQPRWQTGSAGENFFHHLWFLWFLCWLVLGFAAIVPLARRIPASALVARLCSFPVCLLWLVPLTMTTQWFMQAGGPGFGPDTSSGLLPAPHVLLYYAIFFGFGAALFATHGAGDRLTPGRWWAIAIVGAIPLVFVGLAIEYASPGADAPGLERRLLSDLVQVAYAWLMTMGMIGLFESLLRRPRRWVRYLSDASYWLYLAHLPLILVGQGLLLEVDAPPLVKTLALTAAVTLSLLVVYQFAVRYSPIGTMLNGKRTRTPEIAAPATTSGIDTGPQHARS